MSDQRTAEGLQLRERIDLFLGESGVAGRDALVFPLTGDASDRKYFRIIASDGLSIVLALHAGPIDYATLPFARVSELLRLIPLPVPEILGHSSALGILALQDLGDVTLQAHLGAATADEHAALYREAVALIETLQRAGEAFRSSAYPPYSIAFDVEKLTWELDFFLKHFVEAYRGVVLQPREREAFAAEWSQIVDDLASEPRVLCHRDYHSRNLMLHDGRLHIIDFQDARMGPDTYDLVSLLRDSYVDIDEAEVEQLIAYFLELKTAAGQPTDRDSFRRRFDLMALQRNLKALGTFGFQTTTRRNPVYIQYIPRTLRHVKTNLDKYPRFAALRRLLAERIDELA
jgi:N-acetylmuramate 1-kinase